MISDCHYRNLPPFVVIILTTVAHRFRVSVIHPYSRRVIKCNLKRLLKCREDGCSSVLNRQQRRCKQKRNVSFEHGLRVVVQAAAKLTRLFLYANVGKQR